MLRCYAMLRCASLVGNENAQWAMWVDDATRTQIGTQSKAELVSQSFLPSFLPSFHSLFISKSSSSRIGGGREETEERGEGRTIGRRAALFCSR